MLLCMYEQKYFMKFEYMIFQFIFLFKRKFMCMTPDILFPHLCKIYQQGRIKYQSLKSEDILFSIMACAHIVINMISQTKLVSV